MVGIEREQSGSSIIFRDILSPNIFAKLKLRYVLCFFEREAKVYCTYLSFVYDPRT